MYGGCIIICEFFTIVRSICYTVTELTLTDTKWILAEKSKQCGKSTLAIPEKGHHNAVPTCKLCKKLVLS